jgi:signal transduction histidine kinase
MVMALGLTGLSGGVLWLHVRWSRTQFDSELASVGAALSQVMREELEESGNLERAGAEARESIDVPGRATAILRTNGAPISARWYGFKYAAPGIDADAQPRFASLTTNGKAWRTFVRRESSSQGDYLVFVAGSLEPLARQESLLVRVLLVATPLIVVATAALCWWVASAALRPMTAMAAQAEDITVCSKNWQLDAPSVTDELGQLARAFNRLLSRLATASHEQRRFMADASHELRTPVSVIQTATEVTLQRDTREEWEYRDALTIVGEQSARLSRLVGDMFVLARADAGGQQLVRSPLYLDELVAECVRAVSVIATPRDIHFATALQPDVSIAGDDGLLRQLVVNLLDNAVRYGPAGSTVSVGVIGETGGATLTVSDEGPGIPPADRERVFGRFERLDPARSPTSGAGLGLPIARWIAEQHHGTLTVESNSLGGSLFIAHFTVARVSGLKVNRT